MITLKDSIEVEASPEKVFGWIAQRLRDKEACLAWHPDHVELRWIKGAPLEEGSVLYAAEYLGGKLYSMKLRVTKIVPNRVIEYRSLFPASIFAPGNAFRVEPKGENSCVFTATVGLRGLRLPRLPFRKPRKDNTYRLKAVQQHMKEEGENLKKAVEN